MTEDGPGPARDARDPSAFVVTGGAAFQVKLEAMEAASGAIARAGRALEGLSGNLGSARGAAWRGACPGTATAAAFDDEAARLASAADRAAADAFGLARGLVVAAAGYRQAETQVAGWAGVQQLALRVLIGGPLPSAAAASPGRETAGTLRFLAGAASSVPSFVPWGVAGGPGDRISVVRSRIAAGAEDASTFAYAGTSLRQAQGSAPLDDGSGVPSSSILVERIPRTDGTTAVMVSVPGTQSWAPDDPTGGIFDAEGNLDGMAGGESHARQLIERALSDQRLGPRDAVVFNVHSQGSLHVFGMLEDADFRARYPVAAVTVLGGIPTAFRIPENVAVLSVANRDDVVPGLSGLAPVPRPNVVDVRTPSRPAGPGGGLLPGIVAPHSLDSYAADARALDHSTHPSVVGYAAVLGAAVGTGIVGTAGGTIAASGAAGPEPRRERFVYTGTDTATPATQLAQRAAKSRRGPEAGAR